MKKIVASIITIGDELLIGQVIDTNSAWMARELNRIGVAVSKRISIADDAEQIRNTLDAESKNTDVVLITGGLGPTSDDITKQTLCKYFDGKMITDKGALDNVNYLFNQVFHKPVSDVIRKQAEVPDVCTVIQNKRGSAPGMIFEKNETLFVSMPGVPYEMQGMMEEVVMLLQKRFTLPVIIHKTILTAGIGESSLAELIQDFEKQLPPEIGLAYLPSYGMVRLRLSTSGFDKTATQTVIEHQFSLLKTLVKEYTVTTEDESIQQVLARLLSSSGKTISTAESCTGGMIATTITSSAGASEYYKGSIISYSNELKHNLLNVSEETLEKYGAVSEETVGEMLTGLLQKTKTDYGIAVSGIMGPGGGSDEKPVGTVFIAVGNAQNRVVQKFKYRFERSKNIEVTALNAISLATRFISNLRPN